MILEKLRTRRIAWQTMLSTTKTD